MVLAAIGDAIAGDQHLGFDLPEAVEHGGGAHVRRADAPHAAEADHGEEGDHGLGHVRQVGRHAVAGLQALRPQVQRQRRHLAPQLGPADLALLAPLVAADDGRQAGRVRRLHMPQHLPRVVHLRAREPRRAGHAVVGQHLAVRRRRRDAEVVPDAAARTPAGRRPTSATARRSCRRPGRGASAASPGRAGSAGCGAGSGERTRGLAWAARVARPALAAYTGEPQWRGVGRWVSGGRFAFSHNRAKLRAMDAKTQKSELTRAAIVGAAMDLAGRPKAWSRSRCRRVADRIGLSKSGVFSRVGSRETLQKAVIDEFGRRFLADVFVPAMQQPKGLPRLDEIVQRWIVRTRDVEAQHRLHLLGRRLRAGRPRRPAARPPARRDHALARRPAPHRAAGDRRRPPAAPTPMPSSWSARSTR